MPVPRATLARSSATTTAVAVTLFAFGIAGAATAATSTPSPTATSSSTSTPTPSPTTTSTPTPTPTTTPLPPRTTKSAQQRLNDLGCDAGVADGQAGTHTKAAIIRFQAANGLTQTATMTTSTWRKLEATRKVSCTKRPVPASGTGRRIVVSRTQNYVWLVRSDGTVRWQGGIIDNPSIWRTGTYRTGSACGRPAHVLNNNDYSKTLWLQHYTRLQTGLCGVGFHRVPIRKSDGTQIHPDWYLGTDFKESHGCMRVSDRTSREIWDFTQSATKVVVLG